MERAVLTVGVDTPILDAQRLFVEEEVHGAPVVDDDGAVVGVVSTLDLLRAIRDELEPGAGATAPTYFRAELPYAGPDWLAGPLDLQDRVGALVVADAMCRELVACGPEAGVDELARLMLAQRVHRVLILEAGVLLGLVTTFDLLRVLAGAAVGAPAAPPPGAIQHTGYSRGELP
jgi:CBS domain-containing protein